jgi:hypothetical protein
MEAFVVVMQTIQAFMSDWMILLFSISSNQLSTTSKSAEEKIKDF